MSKRSPIVLLILDGWGHRSESKDNAILQADTPQWSDWYQHRPYALLEASGEAVGLPEGQMGNSEVGHMHIGAGRVVYQDFSRINLAIETGAFEENPALVELISKTKAAGKALHLMGLLSPGGVHSHEEHCFAMLRLCKKMQLQEVYLQLFLDGRDMPPKSAQASLERLEALLQELELGNISSLSGRYYAMDRDNRWDRIERVYDLLTQGQSEQQFDTATAALMASYQAGVLDEFLQPCRLSGFKAVAAGDSVLFFNFRADRARQLTQAFIQEPFDGFERGEPIALTEFISMTEYAKELPCPVAFPPIALASTLGALVAEHGLSQLRIAETEKYAHVTFFLNGGSEDVYPLESRILVPSPKVATYDEKPEMSAEAITEAILQALAAEAYDLIICNFANADMLGHTGDFQATVQAIECLDHCMQKVAAAVLKVDGQLLITADHGNAEKMYDENTEQAHTAHTNLPVPFLYIGQGWKIERQQGSLVDVAPSILALLDIPKPEAMTGQSLLSRV